MVFFIDTAGRTHFCGCAREGFAWPDEDEWLPVEVRTSRAWFIVGVPGPTGMCVLVCPD